MSENVLKRWAYQILEGALQTRFKAISCARYPDLCCQLPASYGLAVAVSNFVRAVARHFSPGLLYLHGHVPPIVHRDLKCDVSGAPGTCGSERSRARLVDCANGTAHMVRHGYAIDVGSSLA